MGGGDKIDTIRQEVSNLLHNKKRKDVFGSEEDKIQYLLNKKELLYGNKSLPDGTVKFPSSEGSKIKFYEGYLTQEFGDEVAVHHVGDFESLKRSIGEFNVNEISPQKTTYLDICPKKSGYSDLSL